MANRIRNIQLKINLTEKEKALFEKKMKMAKCKTMNHFLRKVVSETDIYVVDLQPFREIQGLLFRYASSVNQHLSKEIWQIHSLLLGRTKEKGDDV